MKRLISLLVFLFITAAVYSQEIAKWKINNVEKMVAWKDSGILVFNFWATFCKPCVAEIPSFIKVCKKYKNKDVRLTLVSLDLPAAYPQKIADFVRDRKFNAKIAWLEETDADYFCPKIDKSWSGSIPATLIVNTNTGFSRFYEGEMKEREFEEMLLSAMKQSDKKIVQEAEAPKLQMAPDPNKPQ